MTFVTTSLSERIADGIVELIRADGLGPGDVLDSSRELAKRFEVTTPTIREALRRLEATDIIRFRHGSGTYVGEGVTRRLIANPHAGRSDRDSVLELVRARIVLEPSIAAEAARRRTPGDLEVLETASDNALRPQHADERPAMHFHVALAAGSGNPLLVQTIEALLHQRAQDQVAIRHGYDDRERDHAEHRRILDAVRAQDPEAAAELTRSHLLSIAATVEALTTENTKGETR